MKGKLLETEEKQMFWTARTIQMHARLQSRAICYVSFPPQPWVSYTSVLTCCAQEAEHTAEIRQEQTSLTFPCQADVCAYIYT